MTKTGLRLPILIVLILLSLGIHFYWLIIIDAVANSHLFHAIHARFCYIPIVLGALWYGLRGGMIIAVLVSIATFLYVVFKPVVDPNELTGEYTEIFFYVILGGLSGVMLDRARALRRKKDEAEQKLQQAERFALMGKMAASIAHEIKNPLVSIKGAAQILNDESVTDIEKMEFAEIIDKETDRLNLLVMDFLSYSRTSPSRLAEVDICRLLEEAQKQLSVQADKDGIKLDLDANPTPSIKADGDKLHQVLLNIVLNAIQAMPGGGNIIMRCRQSDNNVVIEIVDDGPGIPKSNLDRIFDPFFTTKSQGPGLGLATARAIITDHKGTINVESKVGKGTKFSIVLPVDPLSVEIEPVGAQR